MIRQQINLHQPIFRKQRALFSANIVLRICLIWTIALGAIYVASLWRDRVQRNEVASLEASRDAAQVRLAELTAHQAAPDRAKALQAEISSLQAELAQKEGVLKVVSSGDLGDTTGFAPQIDSLAERRTAGVWLTHIGLTSGGRRIDLKGSATHEDLLPEYLERLADAHGVMNGFAGTRFGKVSIQREPDGETVAFELDTESGSAKP